MTFRLEPFEPRHAAAAAALFAPGIEDLRRRVPALPRDALDPTSVAEHLRDMAGVAAVDDRGELVGYLVSWFPIERFRGTRRSGAYVPEWGHGASGPDRAAVYRAMYGQVSTAWTDAGCGVHAITLLAGDADALDIWFWHGFGLGTVDAVRPTSPLDAPVPTGVTIRPATGADAGALAVLDAEHVRHYATPPVLMAPPERVDEEGWRRFMAREGNGAWIAEDDGGPFGFVRFDTRFDGSDAIESTTGVFITGAYVRPAHRGRGVASAILDAALRHYGDAGLAYCGVDFEGFNPDAAAFWPRSFTPVCYSLLRVPESIGP